MVSQLEKLSLFTAGLVFTFGLSAQSPDDRSDSDRSDDLSDYFFDQITRHDWVIPNLDKPEPKRGRKINL